jgi:hypothetical protein
MISAEARYGVRERKWRLERWGYTTRDGDHIANPHQGQRRAKASVAEARFGPQGRDTVGTIPEPPLLLRG